MVMANRYDVVQHQATSIDPNNVFTTEIRAAPPLSNIRENFPMLLTSLSPERAAAAGEQGAATNRPFLNRAQTVKAMLRWIGTSSWISTDHVRTKSETSQLGPMHADAHAMHVRTWGARISVRVFVSLYVVSASSIDLVLPPMRVLRGRQHCYLCG